MRSNSGGTNVGDVGNVGNGDVGTENGGDGNVVNVVLPNLLDHPSGSPPSGSPPPCHGTPPLFPLFPLDHPTRESSDHAGNEVSGNVGDADVARRQRH